MPQVLLDADVFAAVCSCRTLWAGAVLGDFVLSAMTEPNNISFPGSGANIFHQRPPVLARVDVKGQRQPLQKRV